MALLISLRKRPGAYIGPAYLFIYEVMSREFIPRVRATVIGTSPSGLRDLGADKMAASVRAQPVVRPRLIRGTLRLSVPVAPAAVFLPPREINDALARSCNPLRFITTSFARLSRLRDYLRQYSRIV